MGELTIGEFSRMTHLSVRTLRRYHDVGLLEPAEVDEQSSYRYYDHQQVPQALTIRRLRELDMPVREIRDLLGASEAEQAELIAEHLARVEQELERTRSVVSSLRRLLTDTGAAHVKRTAVPAQQVAAIGEHVEQPDVEKWYAEAMSELDDVLESHGVRASGPAGGVYTQDFYTDEAGELLVYLPVATQVAGGRVEPRLLPPTDLVSLVHVGDFSDLDVSYGVLGRWLVRHDLVIDGPVHEHYLVGPRDHSERSGWRTEIGWPVRARTD